MAEVKWIKLATDVFDNRKIKQIEQLPDGDTLLVIWFKILCHAGNINDSGLVYFSPDIPYTDQMIATEFRRPLSTVQMALKVFSNYGMIELFDDIMHVSNWEKYQNVEGMEKIREQNRIRQKKWYDKQKLLPNVIPNVSITQPNATDIDKDIDKEVDINNIKRFIKPTLEEVTAYCNERNNNIDPQHFIDHYEANGWMVGKTKMKDWKAAVRYWERNNDSRTANTVRQEPAKRKPPRIEYD